MKLSHVAFKHMVTVPGFGAAAEFDALSVPIEYDKATDMVRVGNDPVDVPRADVAQWKRDRTRDTGKVTCRDCAKQFNNAQALGAHRRFKHEESAA